MVTIRQLLSEINSFFPLFLLLHGASSEGGGALLLLASKLIMGFQRQGTQGSGQEGANRRLIESLFCCRGRKHDHFVEVRGCLCHLHRKLHFLSNSPLLFDDGFFPVVEDGRSTYCVWRWLSGRAEHSITGYQDTRGWEEKNQQ